MFKKLFASVFFQKVKAWFIKAGFTSLGWAAIGVGIRFVPFAFLADLKNYISFGSALLFLYINWNVIRKLVKNRP